MVTIYCSNKLKEFIGKEYLSAGEITPCQLGDWNVHVFYFERRKYLMCVNNRSYYSLIIENVKKADFKHFHRIFADRLIAQLLSEKIISPSQSGIIYDNCNPLIFSRTNNAKKTIGTMNEFIYIFKIYKIDGNGVNKTVEEINTTLNNTLMGTGRLKGDYGLPSEEMKIFISNMVNV